MKKLICAVLAVCVLAGIGCAFASEEPDVITYTGSGDDVIEIEPQEGYVFHITGNEAGNYFGVIPYDENDDRCTSLVNTTEPYDGVTFCKDFKARSLEIKAVGEWTVELIPVESLPTIDVGETLSGTGDAVIRIIGAGTSAKITGNSSGDYFGVVPFREDGSRMTSIVNTTDPYEGTVKLKKGAEYLVINAVGDWSITL